MTNPGHLKVAMPVHVAQVVAHALLYDGRRRVRDGDAVMARKTAEWLVERLAEPGYVVMKAEGAAPPSTSETFDYGLETIMKTLGPKEKEIMDFLHASTFDSVLTSPNASTKLKQGVRQTIMRLSERDAAGMVHYYWSAIIGTERSIGFAAHMKKEGFSRFEEAIEDFRERFDDKFLKP